MLAALKAAAASSQQNDGLQRDKSPAPAAPKPSSESTATGATGEKSDKPARPSISLFGKKTSMWNTLHKMIAKEKAAPAQKKYENTYKMKPDPGSEFRSHLVRQTIEDILCTRLEGEKYDPKKAAQLARNLSDVIKTRVKKLHIPRHKIVAHVIVGSCQDQGLKLGSRCVWDEKTDNFASGSFKNGSIFCAATVYGIYVE
uniref:Tctex1 domain-containing protein 1-B-like n=1 Tax=Saccoglossus kowalevskii TaxID=10224 RepID=A0ABM0MYS5_SACKO|nr:PREDICTED: tctex1 domain-containing protein 1-B-like [Saccoglossus kowalevskii]